MKALLFIQVFTLFIGLSGICIAQSTNEEMVKEWERAKAYTKEYLDAMPEKDYALKPKPEMRSFADQMLHITDANYGLVAAATGEKSPYGMGEFEKSGNKSKAEVIKAVMEGYDFVINDIKNLPADKLNEKITLFGKFDMTRRVALEKAFEHQTHHRGQTTVYLRLAGVTPPEEKLF
ncbi:DinB family protein [Chitinophaga filiformis]|uniref:DinB family protein n=1 Tax=Chitinophaga filiformis TaxID=104663 RepID=A0ABY4HYR2_CHIFI|nr:DinB family protein [Chitinophaga filiformis]UPK68697.1 DinB family protein [Chitinophaga filiformis]